MANLNQFNKQQYLNLETFRKNGQGVRTPVWFVQDGEKIMIWTEHSSGKAKRIRNTGSVNIAPCKGDGTLVGQWVPAAAQADDSDQAITHIKGLMQRKYGLAFGMFALLGKLRKSRYITLRLIFPSNN